MLKQLFFIPVFAVVTALHAQTPMPPILPLNEALKTALQNNYSIQLSRTDADIAANNNNRGNAGMLPFVTGSIVQDNGVNNTKQTFLDGRTNNKDNAKTSVLAANIELGWNIFDGFKMFASRNRLQELQELGELRWRSQIENNFTRIMRSYYEVVQAKQLLNVSDETVKLSEERLQLANDRYQAGKAARTEVLQAQVDLNTDKSMRMRQQTQLRNTAVALNQLLARDVSVTFGVPDSMPELRDLKLEELLAKARSQNTNVMMAQRNQKVSAFAIREIRAERMPVIQLRTGYNYNQQNSQAGFLQSSQINGYHYGAALTMNIFNGFDVNKRLQTANLGLRSADLLLRDTISRIEAGVQQAFNTYTMLRELVSFEQQNTKVAEDNFEIAREQYRLGVITPIELRQAQQNLLLSKSRVFSARFEAKLAETELLRLSGEILKLQ
jgi:outer membrane protein TolC